MPRLLGADDDWSAFDEPAFHATLPRMVREARRRNLAVRLPSTGRMVDCLVPTILEQKVTVIEARRGYRYLMYRFGSPAPAAGTAAPDGLRVQPTPEQWLRIPSWEWHQAGVGPQRSATVMRALRSAVALERLAALPAAEAAAKMQVIPGIGVWTAAEVVQRTHGCPDSIAVGDYHLAAYVGAAADRPADGRRRNAGPAGAVEGPPAARGPDDRPQRLPQTHVRAADDHPGPPPALTLRPAASPERDVQLTPVGRRAATGIAWTPMGSPRARARHQPDFRILWSHP